MPSELEVAVSNAAATRYERKINTAERDAEMARFKVGRTYRQVAQHFDVGVGRAYAAVQRAITAAAASGGVEARAEELVKLDAMEVAVMDVLRRRHITVSNGKVIIDPNTTEPLEDDAPILAAVAQFMKITERRAKLLGLDAPARQTLTVLTEDVVDAEIRRLQDELAQLDHVPPA